MQSMCLMLLKSFEDIPGYGVMENFLAISEEMVRTKFEMQALNLKVIFHKGLLNDAFSQFRAKKFAAKIAVFCMDGNFFDAHTYQDALYWCYLYGFVQVGGYVVFDAVY